MTRLVWRLQDDEILKNNQTRQLHEITEPDFAREEDVEMAGRDVEMTEILCECAGESVFRDTKIARLSKNRDENPNESRGNLKAEGLCRSRRNPASARRRVAAFDNGEKNERENR